MLPAGLRTEHRDIPQHPSLLPLEVKRSLSAFSLQKFDLDWSGVVAQPSQGEQPRASSLGDAPSKSLFTRIADITDAYLEQHPQERDLLMKECLMPGPDGDAIRISSDMPELALTDQFRGTQFELVKTFLSEGGEQAPVLPPAGPPPTAFACGRPADDQQRPHHHQANRSDRERLRLALGLRRALGQGSSGPINAGRRDWDTQMQAGNLAAMQISADRLIQGSWDTHREDTRRRNFPVEQSGLRARSLHSIPMRSLSESGVLPQLLWQRGRPIRPSSNK